MFLCSGRCRLRFWPIYLFHSEITQKLLFLWSKKDSKKNNRNEDEHIPNFDGWLNSPNSNFLNPRTYTLSTDGSQESLQNEQSDSNNSVESKMYYFDDCDNELNWGNIMVEY